MAQELVIKEITKDNWIEEVSRIYDYEILRLESEMDLDAAIKELYMRCVSTYKAIPKIYELMDEITVYNMRYIDEIVDLYLKFDVDALTWVAGSIESIPKNSPTYDEDAAEAVDEVSQQIYTDICEDMDRSEHTIYRWDLQRILDRWGLPYRIDYDDDIYERMGFMQDYGLEFLVNDCQIRSFPEFDAAGVEEIKSRNGYSYPLENFTVIQAFIKKGDSSVLKLGCSEGWK